MLALHHTSTHTAPVGPLLKRAAQQGDTHRGATPTWANCSTTLRTKLPTMSSVSAPQGDGRAATSAACMLSQLLSVLSAFCQGHLQGSTGGPAAHGHWRARCACCATAQRAERLLPLR